METITLRAPDDWHLHLRDGAYLKTTVAHAARQFQRAIIMPNLAQPITSVALATAYRERIIAAIPEKLTFTPLMTLYLTDNTTAALIEEAGQSEIIYAAKLYPVGATTHSEQGVTQMKHIYKALAAMEKVGLPLCVHGEVVDPTIDVFDREKYFIERQLAPLRQQFPELKIVFEHITTKDAIEFVLAQKSHTAATITVHHLLLNRNALFNGGIHPHHYCLPLLKHRQHQQALIQAASCGYKQFFLGTDSAPHPQSAKESACGCAGIYTVHAALELYAQVFAHTNALDRLEKFAACNGAHFYGLELNQTTVTLEKSSWQVPEHYPFGDAKLVPFKAGQQIEWRLLDT